MPSAYAHYRFGKDVLPALSPGLNRSVQRFRRMFDLGLQGPDPLFYHSIFRKDAAGDLGRKFHAMEGHEFFTMVCRRYQQAPSEAGAVYLYGLLAHYCLDSVCHPLINSAAEDGTCGHTELETEFDRFLLAMDGKTPPQTYNRGRHAAFTRGECVTVADFYPGVTPSVMHRSLRSMAWTLRFLASPRGAGRAALDWVIRLTGDKFTQHVMPPMANARCAPLDEELFAHYREALALYPLLAQKLSAHLENGTLLGEEFSKPFG